jgi:hypothetical protein
MPRSLNYLGVLDGVSEGFFTFDFFLGRRFGGGVPDKAMRDKGLVVLWLWLAIPEHEASLMLPS